MAFFCLLCVFPCFGQSSGAPDVIRVPFGIFMGITFDKEAVAKALVNTPVKLPDPLPPGARVGFDYEDDFFVLCETPEGSEKVFLTVDANINHDLRDDAKVEIPKFDKIGDGVVVKIKRSYPDPYLREAWLPYRFFYHRTKSRAGESETGISFTPTYRMEGTFPFQGKNYVLRLNDNNFMGMYDRSNLSRGTVLSVFQQDGNATSLSPLFGYELIPLGKEYFEVRDGALDGSWIELVRNTLPHTAIGREIPDFHLTDTEGKTLRLSEYRGRYLLLDFWFSGCVPCIREYPNIKKTIEKYAGKPLSMVGVNLDSEKRLDRARKVIVDNALPWRQVMDGKGYFLPIYQILGLLPEHRMSFPLNVVVDPAGVIRYATNDFRKMERFLEYALAGEKSRPETLFIPLVSSNFRTDAPPIAVDFKSDALDRLLKNPKVKLPADLAAGARVGRLPNDTILIARPASRPDRLIVRLDAGRDLDLTNDEDKEIPILAEAPKKSDEGVPFSLMIRFANGGMMGFPVHLFAKLSSSRSMSDRPEIYYSGFSDDHTGAFFLGDQEYAIRIFDPSYDGLFTQEDAGDLRFLTLKKKLENGWTDIYSGTSRIPIGGRFYRLTHVHEDGYLVELEEEKR
jgi:peroxiredoxin